MGPEKYDETAVGDDRAAEVRQRECRSNRLERLEEQLGIPLPAATQWEIVEEAAELIKPALDELIRQAAQGEVLHNDDTGMRVLQLAREPGDERTGVFTSGIVSTGGARKIALFFTGRQACGREPRRGAEAARARSCRPPIQMCDALSRNAPKLPTGWRCCWRTAWPMEGGSLWKWRQNFPDECRYVLETLGEVYRNDARGAGAGPVAGGAAALPSGAQRAGDGRTA